MRKGIKKIYSLSFYVPETHLEQVKKNLFKAGAGRFKNYEDCCWQIKGLGQFRPKKKSKPFIGNAGNLSSVIEYKVEMICETKYLKAVISALKDSHPYEEPAYQIIKLENF